MGLNINENVRNKVQYDVAIIGGGPAGLSAAIYTSRANLSTVILDEGITGGQVVTTFHVANYPGTDGVVKGFDLAENMKNQALSFGAKILELKEITETDLNNKLKLIKTEDTDYVSKAVIIATGVQPRKLPVEGESNFSGKGIHYCATCDGAFYQNANVLVVGGGDSALEEAVFLTNYAKQVTIIHRRDSFRAAKSCQDKVNANPKINIIFNSRIVELRGDDFLKSVIIEDTTNFTKRELLTDGVFVYIGMEPRTQIFKNNIELDENKYIKTNEDMKTNVPGVFAAGDVRQKKVRQIITAASDGAIAGVAAEQYINRDIF
jgi:thioredoxin reductase (NADPH)